MNFSYESYTHWRDEMTQNAGITLDAAYCRERIQSLTNEDDSSTRSLLKAYGSGHRDQMVRWFEQALTEL